ncbi:Uncharacterised protein [Orientia tsutsugamushi]|uniref:Uncharacterized protein n=1 Tax=Orientia tsutsugamushi TaxID=784 RepID=A0A2R8F2I3_ORITS|nr:Uncharacterised protein [Orientia tsutsugamushi]
MLYTDLTIFYYNHCQGKKHENIILIQQSFLYPIIRGFIGIKHFKIKHELARVLQDGF